MNIFFEYFFIVFIYILLAGYIFFALFIKKRLLLSLDIVMCGFMGANFLTAAFNIGNDKNISIVILYVIFALSFLYGFNLKSKLFHTIYENHKVPVYNERVLRLTSLFLLIFAIFLWCLIVDRIGGINSFLSMSKMQRSLITRNLGFLTFYPQPLFVSFLIILIITAIKREFKYYLFSMIVFIAIGGWAFIKISRTAIFILTISPIAVYLIYSKQKLSNIAILSVLFFLIAFGIIYKELNVEIRHFFMGRSFNFHVSSISEQLNLERLAQQFSSQYDVLKNLIVNPELIPNSEKYGMSYLKSIFIRTIPFIDTPNLSKIYVAKYYPEVYKMGGGRGFSPIAEAFINFSYLGVLIVGILMGGVMKVIQKIAYYYKDPLYVALYIITLLASINVLGKDSTWIINSIGLYQVLPIFLIFSISRITSKITQKHTNPSLA